MRCDDVQVMGNASEFKRAVQLLCSTVSFDRNVTVQVFEASIRYVRVPVVESFSSSRCQ